MITLDGYAASHRAVAQLKEAGTLPRQVQVRSSKYWNNVIEQDHRRIKPRIRPMLGFKRFETAAVTIRGMESAEKIKKGQFRVEGQAGTIVPMPAVSSVRAGGIKAKLSFVRQKHTSYEICTSTVPLKPGAR